MDADPATRATPADQPPAAAITAVVANRQAVPQDGRSLEDIVARAVARVVEDEETSERQTQVHRLVRPLGDLTDYQCKRTDQIYNTDRQVQFKVASAAPPRGDERTLHAPVRPDPYVRTYIDANGKHAVERLSPEQARAKITQETFAKSFANAQLTLEDLSGYRIKVAWRIVREIGKHQGRLLPDEPIVKGVEPDSINPDPWEIPEPFERSNNPEISRDLWPEVIDCLIKAETLDDDLLYSRYDADKGAPRIYPGLALLPPPVPSRWITEDGQIAANYDPYEDRALLAYVEMVRAITRRLYVEQGSLADPDGGRFGLIGMLEPEWVRMCFPTRLQIIAWEELLVEETLRYLVQGGEIHARKKLVEQHGLHGRELKTLLRLAYQLANEIVNGDTEDARALMVLRLNAYVQRAQDALDLKAELNGLKTLSVVQGLSAERQDDFLEQMVDAVKSISAERGRHRADIVGTQVTRSLPAPS